LQRQFKPLIDRLSNEGVLEQRQVLGGYKVLAGDGTQDFCSKSRSCPHCLTKTHRNGFVTYHHQMLGAVWVQPGEKTVFPVAVVPTPLCGASARRPGTPVFGIRPAEPWVCPVIAWGKSSCHYPMPQAPFLPHFRKNTWKTASKFWITHPKISIFYNARSQGLL
jgi:hypothetical protein